MHTCNHCRVELTEKNWYPSSKKAYSYICKECSKKRGIVNYHKNHEHYRAKDKERNQREDVKEYNRKQSKKYYHEKPEVALWSRAKQRAKKKGIEFNIEVTDVIIPNVCPALGIPLEITEGKSGESSPSLDRIDNSKGYIKGNVCVISHKANTIKSNSSVQELKKVLNYMETH